MATAGFVLTARRGLSFGAIALASKAPPYSPHRHDPHPGDNIGLVVTDEATDRSLFYAPGLGRIEPHLRAVFAGRTAFLSTVRSGPKTR